MVKNAPLVSIVIPTYNREQYIERAIKSASNQTYPATEVIVCDNASADRTAEIVEQFHPIIPRLRYIRHESNIGPVGNWFSGIAASKGKYIKLLFSDDVLYPNCIADLIEPLERKDVACSFGEIDNLWNGSWVSSYRRWWPGNLISAEEYLTARFAPDLVPGQLPVSPCAALIRRDVLARMPIDAYRDSYGTDVVSSGIGPDLIMFLSCLIDHSHLSYVRRKVAAFEGHMGSITLISGAEKLDLHNLKAMLKFRLLAPECSPARCALEICLNAIWNRDPRMARLEFRRRILESIGFEITSPVSPFPSKFPFARQLLLGQRLLRAVEFRVNRLRTHPVA